jgi:hypothetical protein
VSASGLRPGHSAMSAQCPVCATSDMNQTPTRAAVRTPRAAFPCGLVSGRLIPPVTIRAASSAADRLAVSPHQFIVAALSFPIGPCRLVGGVVVAARADKGLEVTAVAAGERRGSGDDVR